MNTTINRLKSHIHILLTVLGMTLLLAACTSDSGGYSDDGGDDGGNGCQAGYCLSNGACCPTSSPYYCGTTDQCYATKNDAMTASGGNCSTFRTEGC